MLATLAANLLAQLWQLYLLMQQTLLTDGLSWLTVGLIVVALAPGISLAKMDLRTQARDWLARVNSALVGNKPASAEL